MILKSGNQIRLISMRNDSAQITPGAIGTVVRVSHFCDWSQVVVDWDNGLQLTLSIPPDRVELIPGDTEEV